jgi:cleavage stimulation factor subunit 3
MTARSANTALENVTRGLKRTTLPRLPPVPGFDGDQQFLEQVKLWKAWIAWEKDDPLVLKAEDQASYQQRILHVFKHALMALRFWPEMWVDAAEWCFENNIVRDGKDLGLSFLVDGATANPESALLALKHADHIELTQRAGEDQQAKAALAQAVRVPYDKVLDTLYDMIKKLKEKESSAIAKLQEDTATGQASHETVGGDEDDDEGEIKENPTFAISKKDRIKAVQDGFAVQIQMLSQQISYLWIALARAFRRFQGQGKSSPATGLRGIFTEARGKGRLTSEVYIAIAHIEWDVYQDSVATKIFERGSRLFPESEHFFVEYLKHLHARRDFTSGFLYILLCQVLDRG